MNEKEELKYTTIERIINNKITIKEAMYILNQSRRNINRLINKYKDEGKNGFIHKNKGKENKNKKSNKTINELENLYLKEYYDYNFTAFYDEISEKYDISYDVMLKAFKKDDIISPLSTKKTIKLYNENINKTIKENKIENQEKIELYKSRIIEAEKAHTHIRRSSNLYAFGQEIQMDACFKLWFGGIASALHLAVDKGTKKVLFGWFEYEEITRGYFVLLYNIIINYGIPLKIKTDNRNSFSNGKNKVDTTQFGSICNELGISLVTTSIATSKSNVERENGTFKNRLIAELRHERITDIDSANEYLNNIFIPKMNAKFSYKINKNVMKENNYSDLELNLIISEKYERLIDNASSIKYKNKYYIPVNPNTGETVSFASKTICILIITYDAELWSKIENKYYIMLEIEKRETVMEKEDNSSIKEHKKYIPPSNHPWRKSYKN